MTTLIDLAAPIMVNGMETPRYPADINRVSHEEAAREMAKKIGVKVSDFPIRGSFFAHEDIDFATHGGSHMDSPMHFSPTAEGKPSMPIDQVPLEWFYGDAVLLEFGHKRPDDPITMFELIAELDRIGYTLKKNDIVLIRTGAEDHYYDNPQFCDLASGLSGDALMWLFSQGITVSATDSFTMDISLPIMYDKFKRGDQAAYFPVHRAGSVKSCSHAEKIQNLKNLPKPFGFKVALFPIKLEGRSGAWVRPVAIIGEDASPKVALRGGLLDLSTPVRNCSLDPDQLAVKTMYPWEFQRWQAIELGMRVSEIPIYNSLDKAKGSTHAGTHMKAPWYCGPTCEGKHAKKIDEIPLEWCYGDAVLLDFSRKKPGEAITTADLKTELGRIGYTLKPRDIVLLRTGAEDSFDDDPNFSETGAGLVRESLLWLLDQGVRTIGTDAYSLELPFAKMVAELKKGNKAAFFPVSYAGREKEFCQVEKLYNLKSLPKPFGFKVAMFPIKVEKASGSWVRAVAFL